MKRDKIVLLISEMLVEPRYEDVTDQADFILRKLEKMGMLPPLSTPEYHESTGKQLQTLNKWDN